MWRQAVIKEVTDSNGRIILFIDEIHTVVGAGASEGSMDAGKALLIYFSWLPVGWKMQHIHEIMAVQQLIEAVDRTDDLQATC